MKYTKTETKARWNADHYDQLSVVLPIGSRERIKQHANDMGMSVSCYIRHLIAKDAPELLTVPDIVGGG